MRPNQFSVWLTGLFYVLMAPEGDGGAGGGEGDKGGGKGLTQADIDRAVNDALAKERRKFGADPDVVAKERERLKKLEDAEAERERKEAERKGEYDRVVESIRKEHTTELSAREERYNKLRDELKTERVTKTVEISAATAGAINPKQVAKLMDNVILDDHNQPQVLDDDGKPKLKNGKPYPIDLAVKEFLNDNPHLKKATGTTETAGEGGASGADAGGGGMDDKSTPDLKKLEDDYTTKRTRAEKSGDPMDITTAHKAKRALDEAKAKAKGK